MQTTDELVQLINESKKTLFIFCGLPYSGKTFIAKEILDKTDCVFVSIDNILKELGYDWDTNTLPDAQTWKEIFERSFQESRDALQNELNVLYDSTNHTKESRDVLRTIAQSVDAKTNVLYLDVPVETIWKRWEENAVQKNRSIIGKGLVQMTIESFEPPTADENVITIKND